MIVRKIVQHAAILGLSAVLLLACLVRFFKLGEIPYGPLVDELHFGYISYSLLETGKDEHGSSWPLVFRGFGDYKLPLYAYGTMPFIAQFGLSVFSIRSLSALAGIATVAGFYFLLKKLKFPDSVSLFSALMVALLPWTLIISRIGYESNLTLAVWTFGLLVFAAFWQHRKNWMLYTGAVLFGVTWYGYISYRPVSAVILILLLLLFWRARAVSLSSSLVALAIFAVVVSPFLLTLGGGSSNTARLKQIGIFADGGVVRGIDESRNYCQEDLPRMVCDLVWNKGTVLIQTIGKRYSQTLSSDYMVFEGERSKYLDTDNAGMLYLSTSLLFFLGVLTSVQAKSRHRKLVLLSFLFLIISLFPAIIAGDHPQRVRMTPAFPFFIVISSIGLANLIAATRVVRKRYRKHALAGLWLLLLGMVFAESSMYLINYFTVHTKKYDISYQAFSRDLMPYLRQRAQGQPIYSTVWFSDPVMHYAFHNSLDPAVYQQTVQLGDLEESGFQHAIGVDNFFTTEEPAIQFACDALQKGTDGLYVTNSELEGIPADAVFFSQNKVLGYAFVYSLRRVAEAQAVDCPQETPPNVVQ